jgi:hypothetical protein
MEVEEHGWPDVPRILTAMHTPTILVVDDEPLIVRP